ncbi:GNAT family N-acetyltransferase [Streptomyces sp. NPDC002076]
MTAGPARHRQLYGDAPDAACRSVDQQGRSLHRAEQVCTPVGLPVAVGGIDYTVTPGAGTLWQLGVHPALQSCRIGTLLIRSAEQWIGARGLTRAELGVEESNPRARALYERLGCQAFGRELDSWDVEAEDGSLQRCETMCTLMRKDLA